MDKLKAPVNELARTCARSADTAEWAEFLGRCAPVAALVAVRVARVWQGNTTASVVDDIVQEVFLKLCEHERRILREFKPRGEDSFLALLRVIAASVANDYFRRQRSEKRGGKVVTMVLDEESSSVVSWHRKKTRRSSALCCFRSSITSFVWPLDRPREETEPSSGSIICKASPPMKLRGCRLPVCQPRVWRAPCGASPYGCARSWNRRRRKPP